MREHFLIVKVTLLLTFLFFGGESEAASGWQKSQAAHFKRNCVNSVGNGVPIPIAKKLCACLFDTYSKRWGPNNDVQTELARTSQLVKDGSMQACVDRVATEVREPASKETIYYVYTTTINTKKVVSDSCTAQKGSLSKLVSENNTLMTRMGMHCMKATEIELKNHKYVEKAFCLNRRTLVNASAVFYKKKSECESDRKADKRRK